MNRKLKDRIVTILTYSTSLIAVIILFQILYFILNKGFKDLSWNLITGDYWSENYIVEVPNNDTVYVIPNNLEEGSIFSSKYGVGLIDSKDGIKVTYIDENSPFLNAEDISSSNLGVISVTNRSLIETITLNDNTYGGIYGTTASEMVQILDSSDSIDSLYFKTEGGGIYGSILATLYLILISIVVAFPISVFTAIFITEYNHTSKYFVILERCIEVLAGVPSIIFGLMGMTVLYPILSVFNVSGYSILLGGLTMSVVLLPIIIRSVQEALKVVPNEYRLASLALGATQTQTIFRVVLPNAIPGLLSSVLLSISRVIGESAALIYTTGTFINNTPSPTTAGTSLAVHIWSVMNQEQPNFALASSISIVIMVVVLVLNLILRSINFWYQRKLSL